METELEAMERLASHVNGLATMRALEASVKANIARLEAEIAKTPKGVLLTEFRRQLADAKERQREDEAAVRKAAVDAYIATGDKKPHAAIMLKSYTVLDYDKDKAFAYALEHLPGALKFSKVPFEKVAKVADLDFVTITSEMRPTIAKDLSEYSEI